MEKIKFSIFLLLLIVMLSCNKKNIDNLELICPSNPSEGTITLELEKSLIIDSLNLNSEKPPIFNTIVQDNNDNIFIASNRPSPKVFKFDKAGKFVKDFASAGVGPGELKFIANIDFIENHLFVSSIWKVIEFTTDGEYLSEKKFKRDCQNLLFLNNDTYVANFYKFDDSKKEIMMRCCSIIDKKEEIEIAALFNSNKTNIGRTTIQEGDLKFTLSLADITPDYISCYSEEHKLIYQCLASEPIIYIRGIDGVLRKKITRKFENKLITEEDKKENMKSYKILPGKIQGLIKRNFPKKMTAISTIKSLPNGYFAVYFNLNFGVHEICIFDIDGNFRYIIKIPEEYKTPLEYSAYNHTFTKKGIAMIKKVDDRDLIIEYKIKNLPKIFNY